MERSGNWLGAHASVMLPKSNAPSPGREGAAKEAGAKLLPADAGHQLVVALVVAAVGELVESQVDRLLELGQRLLEARLVVGGGDEPGLAAVGFAHDAHVDQDARHRVVEGVVAELPIPVG